jgi:hypothetical protein
MPTGRGYIPTFEDIRNIPPRLRLRVTEESVASSNGNNFDFRNGADRFMYIYKQMLKKWQQTLLHKQLKMLYHVCNLLENFMFAICPMLISSVNEWRVKYCDFFRMAITAEDNTCFRPLSYSDIANKISLKLTTHVLIHRKKVFKWNSVLMANYKTEDILEFCKKNQEPIHIYGRSTITFLVFTFFNKFPFSQLCAVYNGHVFTAKGNVIGPLNIGTLNRLPHGPNRYHMYLTQLHYHCVQEDTNDADADKDPNRNANDANDTQADETVVAEQANNDNNVKTGDTVDCEEKEPVESEEEEEEEWDTKYEHQGSSIDNSSNRERVSFRDTTDDDDDDDEDWNGEQKCESD